jgi:hypothetical protein
MKWGGAAMAAIALAAVTVMIVPPTKEDGIPVRPDGKPIRVEVLNGSGVRHAGLAAAEALRERGFDVVDIRNADRSDYEATVVLDRVGNLDYAWAVADEIGVGQARQAPDESLLLEVTVILGRDRGALYGDAL